MFLLEKCQYVFQKKTDYDSDFIHEAINKAYLKFYFVKTVFTYKKVKWKVKVKFITQLKSSQNWI